MATTNILVFTLLHAFSVRDQSIKQWRQKDDVSSGDVEYARASIPCPATEREWILKLLMANPSGLMVDLQQH